MSSITAQVLALAMAKFPEDENGLAAGDRVRIEHPLGKTDLHGVTGTVAGPTEIFMGSGWRDAYTISPDEPQYPGEQLAVLATWLRPENSIALAADDPQDEDDDEFECDDECCRGPQNGRDER